MDRLHLVRLDQLDGAQDAGGALDEGGVFGAQRARGGGAARRVRAGQAGVGGMRAGRRVRRCGARMRALAACGVTLRRLRLTGNGIRRGIGHHGGRDCLVARLVAFAHAAASVPSPPAGRRAGR